MYLVLYNIFEKARNNFQLNTIIQNKSTKLFKLWSYIDNFFHNGISGFSFILFLGFFAVGYSLFDEIKTQRNIDFKKYYLKLFGVFFVMYAASLMFGVGVEKLMNESNSRVFTGLITFYNFHTIKNGFEGAALGHLWMFCIAIHGLILLPIVYKFLPQKSYTFFGLLMLFIAVLFKIYIIKSGDNTWMRIFLHSLAYADVMFVGIIVAQIVQENNLSFNNKLLCRFCMALLLLLLLTDDFLQWENVFNAGLKRLLYVLLFSVIFVSLSINRVDNPLKTSVIQSWFSILLFHVPFITMMLYYFRDINNKNPYLFIVSCICITLLSGIAIHYFLYKPLKKIIHKIA